MNKIQNCCEIHSFDIRFFSHEIGTVTAADVATVTEDDDPQSYEVNDVVAKMPQRAETCCNGIDFYNRCSTHILTEKQLQENSYPRPDPENIYTAKVYIPRYLEQCYKHANLKLNTSGLT